MLLPGGTAHHKDKNKPGGRKVLNSLACFAEYVLKGDWRKFVRVIHVPRTMLELPAPGPGFLVL